MNFDLKRPCKNCPFTRGPDAIRFACLERAQEIEEIAYREGFVCHATAEDNEDSEGEVTFHFDADGSSQHCAGAAIMYMRSGSMSVPLEQLDEDELDALEDRLDFTADVFDCEEEFFAANTKG